MQRHPWQYLSIRIIVGWLVVAIVPAIVLFWDFILAHTLLFTQVNSIIASSAAIIMSIVGLERLTQFPGQKSMVTVLPTLLTAGLAVGLTLLIFRLPYSVYYLVLSSVIGVIFCFISQVMLRTVTKVVIGYVPIGRCHDLLDIDSVRWIELTSNYQSSNPNSLPFNAVVADLADDGLTDEWERLLADTTLQGIPVYIRVISGMLKPV